jgi:predicted MFS family arabinose efflux permease
MMKQLKVRKSQATGSTWENLLAGLSYVRHHRLISGLLLLSASGGIFGYSFTTVLPSFVDQILSGEVESYSTLLFGLGIGGIIGTGTTGFLKAKTSPWTVQSIVAIGTGAGLVLFSQTTTLLSSVAAICILGLFTAVFRTSNNAFIQQSVEDQYRGRVMSIHQLSWGITSIGGLFTGALSSYAGVSTALMISGLLFLALSIAIVVLRKPDRISQR